MSCRLWGTVVRVAECAREFWHEGSIAPGSVLIGAYLGGADDSPLRYPLVNECKVCGAIGLTVAGDDPIEHSQYYTVYTSGCKLVSRVSYTSIVITVLTVGWMSENDLLRAVVAVACGSEHPAAEDLLREAGVRVIRVVDAVNCERAGVGAVGVVAGSRVLLGSPEFLLEHGVDLSPVAPLAASDDMLLAAIDGRFAGMVLMGGS